MALYIISTLFILFALYHVFWDLYDRFTPTPMTFYDTGASIPQAKDLPQGFQQAWDNVSENLATKKGGCKIKKCHICGKSDNDFKYSYSYNGYSWTDWDRLHIMFGHVKHGDPARGYYLPSLAFVNMIMSATAKQPL